MSMKIAYSEYHLKARTGNTTRKGALLRFEDDNGVGYADCHPWEEFGDLPLRGQLELLSKNKWTPLTTKSFYFSQIDSLARREGRSVFEGQEIPPSHFLMEGLGQSIPSGFTRVKVKLGYDLSMELPLLKAFLQELPSGVKVRFDFNQRVSKEQFEKGMQTIAPWKEKVDFIEDPFLYDKELWKAMHVKYQIDFACDMQSELHYQDSKSHSFTVIKPAVQQLGPFLERGKRKLVITSYLDHPIGQLSAAYEAARCYQVAPDRISYCGLLSHLVYQTNTFSEQLSIHKQKLVPPEGIGWGFDSLLEKLPWKSDFILNPIITAELSKR